MKGMLFLFALIFISIVPEIGIPLAVIWGIWKCRKPLMWLARTL